MSDLIRRSDAIEAVCEWGTVEERNGNLTIALASAKQDVADILSALPSAVCDDCIWHVCNYNKVDWDALSAEVAQGEWIMKHDGIIFKRTWGVCPRCGNTLDFDKLNAGRGDANYCPNCGAKMKGGKKNV